VKRIARSKLVNFLSNIRRHIICHASDRKINYSDSTEDIEACGNFLHLVSRLLSHIFAFAPCIRKLSRPEGSMKGKKGVPYPMRSVGGVLSLLVDKPLKSVTHGQCDTRLTVTFPAAGHHCPLTGTKLCCFVTEARVCVNNLPKVKAERPRLEPATF